MALDARAGACLVLRYLGAAFLGAKQASRKAAFDDACQRNDECLCIKQMGSDAMDVGTVCFAAAKR